MGAEKACAAVSLLNIALCGLLLLGAGVKDRGTILAAGIGTLAVQFGRIMRHAEEYLQQLLI